MFSSLLIPKKSPLADIKLCEIKKCFSDRLLVVVMTTIVKAIFFHAYGHTIVGAKILLNKLDFFGILFDFAFGILAG
jgi:hypothetical protein